MADRDSRTAGAVARRGEQLLQWFERRRSSRAALVVFGFFSVVYLATAAYGDMQSVDTAAAAIPAWQLVENGTLRVDEFRNATPWFVDTPRGVYSNRFPGVIFIGVPAYGLAKILGLSGAQPSLVPAGVTAAVLAAGAMSVLYLVFTLIAPRRIALAGCVVAGLGTGTWSVSSDALWTHGPAQLYLVLGMAALAHERYATVGVAHALAVLTRPQLAVIPLVSGLAESLRRRSVRPALIVGLLSSTGLAALMIYNLQIFGEANVTGGYASYATENLTGMSVGAYLWNWLMTFFSPLRGLLFISPFLLAALPRLRAAWRLAPAWCRTSAVSGLVYLAVQLRLNLWHGGDAFFGYRLPLESLTLGAPLMLLSIRAWLAENPARPRLLLISVVVAVVLQAFGATMYLPLIAGA